MGKKNSHMELICNFLSFPPKENQQEIHTWLFFYYILGALLHFEKRKLKNGQGGKDEITNWLIHKRLIAWQRAEIKTGNEHGARIILSPDDVMEWT
jgi:hypothetical protein